MSRNWALVYTILVSGLSLVAVAVAVVVITTIVAIVAVVTGKPREGHLSVT